MKVCTIVGARPQFVKVSALARAFRKTGGIDDVIIHTGQHYDQNMSDIFFDELEIGKPKYNLNIGSGLQGEQTGKMMAGIEKVLLDEKPDWVVIYGDTNSTLAGALVASKLHIKTAHIEAGLRSFNMRMPEEVNRIVSDHVSTLLFAPTKNAMEHLKREGLGDARSMMVGDVMLDCALHFAERNANTNKLHESLNLGSKPFILATIHRAENTDSIPRLRNIVDTLNTISETHRIILPLHPRTRKQILSASLRLAESVEVIDPVGYFDMLQLEKLCTMVVTDSGGVQKEAYFFKKPCVTLRDETEWVELVESGWNKLASPNDAKQMCDKLREQLGFKGEYRDLYGDGHAAEKILDALKRHL